MLKTVILINFVLLVISLFSGLFFVYKDKGEGERVLRTLIIRVSLAVSLMLLITYGIFSGQIGSRAPWDAFPAANDSVKQPAPTQSTEKAPIKVP